MIAILFRMIGSLVTACSCMRRVLKHSLFGSQRSGYRVLKHSLFGSQRSGYRRAACKKKAGEPGSTECLLQGRMFRECLLVCFYYIFN
jgi:hypothetical protein